MVGVADEIKQNLKRSHKHSKSHSLLGNNKVSELTGFGLVIRHVLPNHADAAKEGSGAMT